ncbi:MAG: bifunctional DNA primase/polymerase [Desulfomonilaceae bacterium]
MESVSHFESLSSQNVVFDDNILNQTTTKIRDNYQGQKFDYVIKNKAETGVNCSAAEALYDRGFRIFPLWGITDGKCDCGKKDCDRPGKHPNGILAPHGLSDASNKADDIDAWWTEAPNANIGIKTGGDIIVLDIDGKEGEATLTRLQGELGSLPATLESKTGNGRHLYFHKSETLTNSKPEGWEKLDVRGDGGYVVGPGSTHCSGRKYEWVDPSQSIAQLPDGWVQNLKTKAEPLPQPKTEGTKVPVGNRNNYLSNQAFHFRKCGLSADALFIAVNQINHQVCEIPLSDSEIRAICRGKAKVDPDPIPQELRISQQREYKINRLCDLLKREIPPTEWIVPGLLPSGLILLGGKSKAGKSWFVLNLSIAIAEGKLAFEKLPCSPQKVFYISLEDHERRIQYRANKLLNDNPDVSENLLYATEWPRFLAPSDKGNSPDGLSELRKTLISEQNISLIIVDTWQKVRPNKRGFRDDYESDYAHLAQIQELAQKHNCAIMLVHHARKDREGAEKQDSLLGSTAIAGAADLIWILERKHQGSEGILTPSGRDIEDESPIVFSFDSGVWKYQGRKSDIDRTDNQRKVLDFIQNNSLPVSFKEIDQGSGVKHGSLPRVLEALVKEGAIEHLPICKKYRLRESLHLKEEENIF